MAGAEYGPDEATTLVNVQEKDVTLTSSSDIVYVPPTDTVEAEIPAPTNTEVFDTARAAVDDKYRLEQVVTYRFQAAYPEFLKTLKDMSANQLRRAWAASILHPLADKPARWSYPIEEKAFKYAVGLDESKFSMLLLGIDRYPDIVKAQAKAESEAADAVISSTPVQSEEEQSGTTLSSDQQLGASSQNIEPMEEQGDIVEAIELVAPTEKTSLIVHRVDNN